jgi:hypothetical protein
MASSLVLKLLFRVPAALVTRSVLRTWERDVGCPSRLVLTEK